jgi:TonB family protein
MLQPLQLKDVSSRYPVEIAELRDFLGKAGFVLGTADTLSVVAASLLRDRAFHRDLILHVWVLIDRCGVQISPSDLLGVLAIAAAGQHFAAEASEDDAHDLLRFVMEARRSMDAPTHTKAAEPLRTDSRPMRLVPPLEAPADAFTPAAEPLWTARSATTHVTAETVDPSRAETTHLDSGHPETVAVERAGGKRTAWAIALALCLLALGSLAVWQFRKPSSDASAPAASTVATTTTKVSPERAEMPNSADSRASIAAAAPTTTQARPAISRDSTAGHARETSEVASAATSAVPRSLAPPPPHNNTEAAAPILRAPSATVGTPAPAARMASPATAAPVIARSGTTRPATATVPADALSKQLGSSTIPAYAALPDADATTDGRRYPRLLRRRMPLSGSGTLVADLRLPGAPNASGSAPAIPVGVVRPTSIGIMAGNLIYSPTPAYPVAAAAAHVQGEVKVQAEIDRDGNVVSARVVSGPPMLRDAAVDAIQHWRYKPWTAGGKTVPMSAVAVVDFQLP